MSAHPGQAHAGASHRSAALGQAGKSRSQVADHQVRGSAADQDHRDDQHSGGELGSGHPIRNEAVPDTSRCRPLKPRSFSRAPQPLAREMQGGLGDDGRVEKAQQTAESRRDPPAQPGDGPDQYHEGKGVDRVFAGEHINHQCRPDRGDHTTGHGASRLRYAADARGPRSGLRDRCHAHHSPSGPCDNAERPCREVDANNLRWCSGRAVPGYGAGRGPAPLSGPSGHHRTYGDAPSHTGPITPSHVRMGRAVGGRRR